LVYDITVKKAENGYIMERNDILYIYNTTESLFEEMVNFMENRSVKVTIQDV